MALYVEYNSVGALWSIVSGGHNDFRGRFWIISELSSLLLKLRRSIHLVEPILSYRQDQTAYLIVIMSMYVGHKILAYLVDE